MLYSVGALSLVSAARAIAATPNVVIRVGYQPNLGGARYFVAHEAGIFAKNGIEVHPVRFSVGSKYFAAFDSGAIDVGWLGTPPTSTGIALGVPMRVFAIEARAKDQEGLVVHPKSGIRSLRDLKGKRIATKRGSSGDVALQAALQRVGLSTVDITFVDLDVNALLVAFKAGRIDGGWYWEPWQGLLREAGGVQIATDHDSGALIGWTWAARTAWLERNSRIVQSFLRALDQGAAFMRRRPRDAAAFCARKLGISSALALRVIAREGDWPTMAESWLPSYPESMNPAVIRAGRGAVAALRVNAYAPNIEAEATSFFASAIDTRPLSTYLGEQARA